MTPLLVQRHHDLLRRHCATRTRYNIPDSSSSACSINSSLTNKMRRGMRKIMVDAQAADNTTMARLSATGVAKWPPRYAPNCENSEPIPICKNPIVPDAVPAASGRTLMAPAAEFDITKALPNITSIWVPNSHDG